MAHVARLCALGRSLGAPRPSASRLDPRRAPRSARLRALTPEEEARYFTLGVSPGASAEAVKRAYKRLAKQYHPDVCDAPDADARFAEIKSAYETLAAERGVLGNVGTEEWRAKWSAQLAQMRDVERGRATVNVRRRRVARRGDDPTADDADAPRGPVRVSARAEAVSELEAALRADDDADPEELAWQREQETRWAVQSQLANLRDRTRRRRRVAPPQKGKFVEPFADVSPTSHDDEWNHSVQ
jgi:curved DNA-binding protein CbpA